MIYLDYNATTPVAKEVADAMMPFILKDFGNPSSSHSVGKRAKGALEKARGQVAELLGCQSSEVIFTSGGSESNNMVLKGVPRNLSDKGRHIITTEIEHPAIMNPCIFLMENGYDITFLPVNRYGSVDPDDVRKALRKDTILISVMHANNETGTIQPIEEIGCIAREYGVLFHTDAAQSVGKIETDVNRLGVDLLTVAGHKLYAPKGVGALYVRSGVEITPLIHGAGQELGRRAGTENTILIVGLGAACELAMNNMRNEMSRLTSLRNRLNYEIVSALPETVLNGHPEKRLPNTLNIAFPGIDGGGILDEIPELCASTGAACHDRSISLSHVLAAMGVSKEVGMGTIRLTLGRYTTEAEVDQAADWLIEKVKEKRKS
ncbi:MAG: cysteine desulfurase family protein [Pseudomonadota bacterium]